MAVRDDKLHWLIRDPNNTLRGPYTHAEISQFINKKALRPKTEISQANSYWFAIEEKTELDRFFSDTPVAAVEAQDFTSTLTESYIEKSDPKIELTQFVASPLKQKAEVPKPELETQDAGVQWLSDEYAEEFGISLEEPASSTPSSPTPQVKTRSNVPTGEIPLMRTPAPKAASPVAKKEIRSPGIVTMNAAVAPGAANIERDPEQEVEEKARKLALKWILLGALLLISVAASLLYFRAKSNHSALPRVGTKISSTKNIELTLRRAFLFSDLELAKSVSAELSASGGNEYLANLATAMIKKNFLVDLDGALLSLNAARSAVQDSKLRAEIDNLIGIFNSDKDILGAATHAKLALDAAPGESIYRYNLALAEFISGDVDKAEKDISAINPENTDKLLYPETLTLRGWISESLKKPNAEEFFQHALEIDPYNGSAQLLLALHKLQEKRFKEAESEFRKFVDLMPELDSFHLENFRKMSSVQLIDRVRIEMRALNSGGALTRALPATMAADALLSANQNKLTEADKILEAALMTSPGNIDLLKARAYLRWKEAKYDEIVELLKDLPREQRGSFGYNLLLGMAYSKLGKYPSAIRSFQVLTDIDPERSEAWSLYGEAQVHLKQNIEAKQNFQRALSKNPTDIRALQGLYNLGEEKLIENPSFAKLLPF